MHSHDQEPPDISKGYEVRDVSTKQLAYGALGFFIFAAVAGAVVWVALKFLGYAGPPAADRYIHRRMPGDPNPLLQNDVTARTDIWNLRSKEEAELSSYGWVDKSKGIAHIPIDEAINMAAAKGPQGAGSLPMASTGVLDQAAAHPTELSGVNPNRDNSINAHPDVPALPTGTPRTAPTGMRGSESTVQQSKSTSAGKPVGNASVASPAGAGPTPPSAPGKGGGTGR